MKKILIISSARTGHGHLSIANALSEQLKQYDDIQTDIVDGFLFFGRLAVKASGIYGPITRWGEQLWKLNWDLSLTNSESFNQMISMTIHDRFMQQLKNDPPSLIISVHAMFNASITSILTEHKINIPFITLLADIVDIHPMWADKNADFILCPTDESLNACAGYGVSQEKLHRCGFPTRQRFSDAARQVIRQPYPGGRPLECLLMSGGEGSGNLKIIAKHLLNNFDVRITIICGRNKRMKSILEKKLSHHKNKINILGFCANVQDYMMKADLTVMRGSPNSMMEAVICNTPLIITGSLPGQEASNPEYAEKNGLGIICRELKKLPKLIQKLLENNSAGLTKIIEKQQIYRNFDSALEIAQFLVQHTLETQPIIPDTEYKFPLFMQAIEKYRKLEKKAKVKRKPKNKKLTFKIKSTSAKST